MSEQKYSPAEYRKLLKKQPLKLVDVKAPSGFVFQFQKPSKFAMLFGTGDLPQLAASGAVEAWTKDGVINPEEIEKLSPEARVSVGRKAFEIRDKVLALSHNPKIVIGEPQNDNELSTEEIEDEDLEYLFKWVAAGGETSAMLAMFPEQPPANALASASRKPIRKAA